MIRLVFCFILFLDRLYYQCIFIFIMVIFLFVLSARSNSRPADACLHFIAHAFLCRTWDSTSSGRYQFSRKIDMRWPCTNNLSRSLKKSRPSSTTNHLLSCSHRRSLQPSKSRKSSHPWKLDPTNHEWTTSRNLLPPSLLPEFSEAAILCPVFTAFVSETKLSLYLQTHQCSLWCTPLPNPMSPKLRCSPNWMRCNFVALSCRKHYSRPRHRWPCLMLQQPFIPPKSRL